LISNGERDDRLSLPAYRDHLQCSERSGARSSRCSYHGLRRPALLGNSLGYLVQSRNAETHKVQHPAIRPWSEFHPRGAQFRWVSAKRRAKIVPNEYFQVAGCSANAQARAHSCYVPQESVPRHPEHLVRLAPRSAAPFRLDLSCSEASSTGLNRFEHAITLSRVTCGKRAPLAAITRRSRYKSPSQPCARSTSNVAVRRLPTCPSDEDLVLSCDRKIFVLVRIIYHRPQSALYGAPGAPAAGVSSGALYSCSAQPSRHSRSSESCRPKLGRAGLTARIADRLLSTCGEECPPRVMARPPRVVPEPDDQ